MSFKVYKHDYYDMEMYFVQELARGSHPGDAGNSIRERVHSDSPGVTGWVLEFCRYSLGDIP